MFNPLYRVFAFLLCTSHTDINEVFEIFELEPPPLQKEAAQTHKE